MKQFAVIAGLWASLFGLTLSAAGQAAPPAAPGRAAPPAAPPRYQGKLSTDPAQYIADVQLMMASTNNAAARAAGSRLKDMWASNQLTATQQGRIVALSQTMLAKQMRPRPQFESLFNAIVSGKTTAKLSDAQMDQFLDVLTQTVEKEAPAETAKFLASTTRYFNGGYLYKSGFSSLRATGGTISFAYSPIGASEGAFDFNTPEPAKPKEEVPVAKPAPKPAAAAPVKKAAPKPAPKKKSSDGWDSADLWSSGSSGSGWGDDAGWGAPVKKKAPAKKPAAKSTAAKTPAAPAAKDAAPAPKPSDFDSGGFGDSGGGASNSPAYSTYNAPPARGAVLVLKDADLKIASPGDSIVLTKVSGTAGFATSRFIATGGQMAWTVKGNPVTAELAGFDFDLSKPEFTAEPVTLTYAAVLEAPVKGALSYKSTRRKAGATETGYPRFISLTNDARIKTLGPNIKYKGGISMAGSRLLSAALDGSVSTITVSLDGKEKFRADSRAYVLSDSVITAARAAISIYQGLIDSVYHPGVAFKYLKGKQLLKLNREDGMYKNTPYIDTYHQLDIRTEMVSWKLTEPKVEFTILTAKNQQTANFESREYFATSRYQQIKSINHMHPLQFVVGYSQSHGGVKTVNVLDMATATGQNIDNLRSAMAGIARDGYVNWNGQTGEVNILPKGFHYVLANRDKKDYDHIALKSLAGNGKNATLNLTNNELLIRGVERFNFSNDTSTVFAQPDSSLVRVGKNRDMKFNGAIVAANMRFKGKDFKFDYNGFYVDMNKIDSILIRNTAKKPTAKGEKPVSDFALTNKTQGGGSGRLYLNDPLNKSGRKKKLNYPSFDSKSSSAVYFGKQDVLGGAYDSTLVFDIPPFKMDSLNGSAKTKGGFDGTFRSKGILPDFKTKLTPQPDGSLGFVYDIPKDGFAMYKGKGKVTGKVVLDAKGLQTDGTVKYQSGTFTSDSFVLYKDSAVAVGKTGVVAARADGKVNTPKMTLPAGYLMHWAVKSDSMYLATPATGEPITLYTPPGAAAPAKGAPPTGYRFTGTALLTPTGAGGNGRLDGPQSYVKSPELTFKSDSYSGKKAALSIKSAEAGKPALTANDVAFNYDMTKGYADFTREEGSKAAMELPYSQFKTTLSGGHWDFKKKRVDLKVAPGADSTKSYFYSTNPDQHGLRFRAATGVYDMARYRLEAGGVPHIGVADSWIIPDSGRVSVLAKGVLKPFKNAGVAMDSMSKFHQLTRGNIKVLSRDAFTGDAMYTFKTVRESYDIKFSSFETDSSSVLGKGKKAKPRKLEEGEIAPGLATVATGVVDSKTVFQLAPRMAYRGDVKINSQRRGLLFDGQIQLRFGKSANAEWFALRDTVDPKNIAITLRNPKAEDGAPLVTGLYMSDQTNKVYPLYVSTVPNSTDVPIFTVDGKLSYNEKRGLFTLSRVDADDPNVYQGAVLTFKDSTGVLGFRGPMSFINSNKNYTMMGSGVGSANPDSARYTVDALMGIDINMPAKAVEVMGEEIAKITKNSPEATDGSSAELYKLGQFIGDKGVESYSTRKGSAPASLPGLASKLANHTLLLSKVNLRWSEKKKAWYSVGPIGLAGVGKQSLNALVEGHVEIKRDNGTDFVAIYLEPEPQSWYYFNYANNVLVAKSANETFDAQIGSKAKGDRETATEYGVFLGDFNDVDGFRGRFQRDYLGKSGKLAARPPAPVKSEEPGVDTGKKKKKKGDDAFGTDADSGPGGAAPAAAAPDATAEAATAKKKKKKVDPNDPFADGAMPDPNATPVAEAPAKKEKVKVKTKEVAADAPSDAPTDTPEPPKKAKKKVKIDPNDPFATSEAEPEPEPVKVKEKVKEKPAAPVADTPPAATPPATTPAATTPPPASEPATTPAATPPATTTEPATTPPATTPPATTEPAAPAAAPPAAAPPVAAPPAAAPPAADPGPDPAIAKKEAEDAAKEAARLAKEAAQAAKDAEKAAKDEAKRKADEEKKKADEEKKKKANENDPFGGS